MGLLSVLDQDEVITVRTYKLVPGAQVAWANTYELIVDDASQDRNEVVTRLNALKNAFVNLERPLLGTPYVLDRIVISTYVPDGTRYNPYTFVSFPVNLSGTYNTPPAFVLPLQFCTVIKRSVAFGRQGTLLYRGAVNSNDSFTSSAGTTIVAGRLNGIIGLFNTFLGAVRQLGFDLVMARGRESVEIGTLRRVTGFEGKTVMTFKKLNNRYFDRLRR
jgi:hypothetical protein